MKSSACARFSTVLGPGSDGNHEEHIHLDLAARRNNYKLCEWDVREPAPPAAAVAQAEAKSQPADDADSQDDDTALIPLDMVPLPRPRPKLAEDAAVRPRKSDRN